MFCRGTNCGKGEQLGQLYMVRGTIGGAVFGPAGLLAVRTTYGVTGHCYNFYQLLVIEICRNTFTSRDKTVQLLQNHFVSHHTHSQSSVISFLWFRVICGSIAIVQFQRSHNLEETLEILHFRFFVP